MGELEVCRVFYNFRNYIERLYDSMASQTLFTVQRNGDAKVV
jgi:hypothetical protein